MGAVLLLFLGIVFISITGCETTCEPVGTPYCEGDVLKVCTGDGDKGVMEETDCAASGQVCAFNGDMTATPHAECRPAECEDGWACFSSNVGERMCDLAGESVFVCVDEGDGCFGWEFVEDCTGLGAGLSCVDPEDESGASCQ